MERFFNNAGPSVAADHYVIDPLHRLDLSQIEDLIAQKRYFVLHAPRQTGKTTCLLALMEHLNRQGCYQALYANIEAAQAARGHVKRGIRAVAAAVALAARVYLHSIWITDWLQAEGADCDAETLFTALLQGWAMATDKPVVLFLDEVDALVGDTLISLLRQIRAGYAQRPHAFPISIVLCGVRDVRDYRMQSPGREVITGGSAFNIKAMSLRLGNLSETEVRALWQQHTQATGQIFADAIYPELWQDTQGQPWLVNALGYELTQQTPHLKDRTVPITLADYRTAREKLIQDRTTHLDQLTDKLSEERVHRVIAALLAGTDAHADIATDDAQYVADLGLITLTPSLQIANRIYQEAIPRELIWTSQLTITHQTEWYVTPHNRLDMPKLLLAFQQFFREQSDSWIECFDYKEAGPQLLLQAFLQRVVNGGGRITREYGLGRRRTDLYLEWPVDRVAGWQGEIQRIVLELKLRHASLKTDVTRGLQQTAAYADQCGATEAHLLMFDRRPDIAWQDRIWHQEHAEGNRQITVWGL